MNQISDGAQLFVRDWGQGPPILFVSAWGFSSQTWAMQTLPLASQGWRCVAFDRRGHGRSDDLAFDANFDRLADDVAAVIDQLSLRDVVLVAHSFGAGEAVRYLARHGNAKVRRLVLIAPCTPCLQVMPDNPDGQPAAAFDAMRQTMAADFPAWLDANEAGYSVPHTSPGMARWVKDVMLQASLHALLQCHTLMTRADLRGDVRSVSVPTLVLQGDADLSMPLALTGQPTAALSPAARLQVMAGAPHGLTLTHAYKLNRHLAAFAL
jgi:non-heme chloroperoxidase